MQEGAYPAQFDRLFLADMTRGVGCLLSGTGAFAVTQHAAGPNMSVDVAPGRMAVPGTDAPNQGSYICWSDAVENPPVVASPPAGQSRIDLVVVQVQDDNVIGGGVNGFLVTVIEGTAATTGTQVAPVIPHSSIAVAQLNIGPNAASITTAMIQDMRPGYLPSTIPTGSIQFWVGNINTPPPGWLVANGQAISRTGIGAALFAMIGTQFGTGNGSTTFNLPDLRGRFVCGTGTGGSTGIGWGTGVYGGALSVTLTKGNLPSLSHAHGTNNSGNSSQQTVYTWPSVTNNQIGTSSAPNNVNVAFGPSSSTAAADPGGSAAPFNIVPPGMGAVPLIKL
jgi:microcystin-dependent protein